MKKLLFLTMLVALAISSYAGGLNRNATYIKENYSAKYENTVKKHAVEEWGTDYEMIVYEINKQCDALFELVNAFKSDYTQIAYNAISDWSIDGYEHINMDKLKSIEIFGVKELLDLHCDWEMVKYEYDKQVKAKNSF